MSLFSTITHGEAPALRGISPKGIGMAGLVLVAGMALGYAISTIDLTSETATFVPAEAMSHGQFLELNTTALWWEPMVPERVLPAPEAKADPFTWANVGSYAALNEPWQVERAFTEVNTALPVYGPELDNTVPFNWINDGSYAALIEGWEIAHTPAPGFVEMNTNLTSNYVEPTSGPR